MEFSRSYASGDGQPAQDFPQALKRRPVAGFSGTAEQYAEKTSFSYLSG